MTYVTRTCHVTRRVQSVPSLRRFAYPCRSVFGVRLSGLLA